MCACVHQGVPACAWGHLCMCVCTCMTVCTHVCLYPVPCEGALVSDIWSRQALPGTLGLTRLSLSTACGCRGAAGLCGPLGTQLGSPRRPSWEALLQVGGTRRATGSHGRRGILHGAPKRRERYSLGTTSWDPGQLLHCPPGILEGDLETALTSQHLLGESPPARPSLQCSDTQASGDTSSVLMVTAVRPDLRQAAP